MPPVEDLPLIDYGIAAMALPGETESGDRCLVKPAGSTVLVSVVDGLGHGSSAARAASAAVTTLEQHAADSLPLLVERCHAALQGTRGAVLSVARFDRADGLMTWLGVGNVEGMLARGVRGGSPVSLVTTAGIVGRALPRFQATVLPLAPGDTLLLASDGIRHGYADLLSGDGPPQELADEILARFATHADDALVLVARYLGPQGAPA